MRSAPSSRRLAAKFSHRGPQASSWSRGGAERADPAALAQSRAEGEAAAVLGGDEQLLLHADGEGDVVFVEEVHPCEPDELPVRQEQPDARRAEDRQVAPHQRDPLAAVAGAAVVVEHAPDQRHARPPGDDGQHQDVDVARAELPLGAVEREMPRAARARGARPPAAPTSRLRGGRAGRTAAAGDRSRPPAPWLGRSQARWLRFTVRALTMPTTIRQSVSSRLLLSPTCGRSICWRVVMAR